MPHHSAQKRHANAAAYSQSPSHPATFMMSTASFPPRRGLLSGSQSSNGGDLRPDTMQSHHEMSPHHVTTSPSWASQHPGASGKVHHVGSRTESETLSGPKDQSTPTKGLSSVNIHSFDSPHEVAASVLLLAASKMRAAEEATSKMTLSTSYQQKPNTDPSPSVPHKKRKKAADIMRKKTESNTHAHVSPMSHGTHPSSSPSVSTSSSPETSRHSNMSHGNSPSSSYELKDVQVLPASAKINDTKEISCPPSHVEIPHFPSMLHAVLSESEFAESVLKWLAHGQAWKIVRWDALRRQVLPKYFGQLRDEKEISGSVDAFLWHLQAWGFEEITDGPDAGAYTNVLFRRELPQLCREMRFSPAEDRQGEGDESRAILQVPSLSSHGVDQRAHCEEKKEDNLSPRMVHPVWRGNLSYRHGSAMHHDMWKSFYPTEPPQWVGTSPNGMSRTMPPYSPIRVRSGRGAGRVPPPRTTHKELSQPSYPVSNRGRGGPASRRVGPSAIRYDQSPTMSAVTPNKPRPILKRKLPIKHNRSTEDTQSDTDESYKSMGSDSKRSKLEAASSNDTMDVEEMTV